MPSSRKSICIFLHGPQRIAPCGLPHSTKATTSMKSAEQRIWLQQPRLVFVPLTPGT